MKLLAVLHGQNKSSSGKCGKKKCIAQRYKLPPNDPNTHFLSESDGPKT